MLPKLTEWLDSQGKRYMIVQGGPGTGKSMIMAWLSGYGPEPSDVQMEERLDRVRGLIKAAHFCASNTGSIAPKSFAERVSNQLASNVEKFKDVIVSVLKKSGTSVIVNQNVGTLDHSVMTGVVLKIDMGTLTDEACFNNTFRDPLRELYSSGYDKPMLVMVDALDEAVTYTGSPNLVKLLSNLSDLPDKVRILMTTRDSPPVLKYFAWQSEYAKIDLEKDFPPGTNDIYDYAKNRLGSLEEDKRDGLAKKISDAADANFLYASLVIDDLLKEPAAFDDISKIALPEGLNAFYQQNISEDLDDKWFDVYRPLLGLIAVSQSAGFSYKQLRDMLGKDIQAALSTCKQFLVGSLPDGPFRIFHKSFSDFLLDKNGAYYIDPADMHQLIVDYYAKDLGPADDMDFSSIDDYGLRFLPYHLYAVAAKKENRMLLYALAKSDTFVAIQRSKMPDRPDVPLTMINTAMMAAAEADDPVAMAELTLINAKKISDSRSGKTPIVALRNGSLEEALRIADLYEPAMMALAYLTLIWELDSKGKTAEAKDTLQKFVAKLGNVRLGTLEWPLLLEPVKRIYGDDQNSYLNIAKLLLRNNQIHLLCDTLIKERRYDAAIDVVRVSLGAGLYIIKIAGAIAKDGLGDRAERLLDEVLPDGPPMTKKFEIPYFLILPLSEAGFTERALKLAKDYDAKQDRVLATPRAVAELVRAGKLDDAAKLARDVDDKYFDRGVTLASVSVAMAHAGRFDDAIKLARDSYWEEALIGAAATLAEIGQVDKALDVAARMNFGRVEALSEIALVVAQAGQKERGESIFKQALSIAETKSSGSTAELIAAVASKIAKAGMPFAKDVFGRAVHMADNYNFEHMMSGLESIALRLIDAGFKEQAKLVFNRLLTNSKLSGITVSVKSLTALVSPMLENGMEEALDVIDLIIVHKPDRQFHDETSSLIDLALMLAQAGLREESKAVFSKMQPSTGDDSSDSMIQEAYPDVALALALDQAGFKEEADSIFRAAIRSTNKDEIVAEDLDDITSALAKAGRVDEALALARKIQHEPAAGSTYADITLALAKAGRIDDAMGFSIKASWRGNYKRLFEFISILVKAGRAEGATEIASIDYSNSQGGNTTFNPDLERRHIAMIFAISGCFDEAAKVIQLIDDRFFAKQVGGEVSIEMALAGRAVQKAVLDEAFITIRQSQGELTAEDWVDMATAYGNAGFISDSRRIFSQALDMILHIAETTSRNTILKSMAKKQAELGFEECYETLELVTTDREEAISLILRIIIGRSDREGLKRIMASSSKYGNTSLKTCAAIAQLYQDKKGEIGKLVMRAL